VIPVEQLPAARRMSLARRNAARHQLVDVVNAEPKRWRPRWRSPGFAIALGFTVAVGGGAAASSIYLTKGPIPSSPKGGLDFAKAPDFIAVAGPTNTPIGYAPRADVVPPPANQPLSGQSVGGVVPVYAGDLTTLIGHLYPGIGFVKIGKSPGSVPCMTETVSSGATTATVPCWSTLVVLPNVVGMVTPTGVAEISSLGFNVNVTYAHSSTVPDGYIISISPPPTTKAHARTIVTVTSSYGP
jgi:hypothetical protein